MTNIPPTVIQLASLTVVPKDMPPLRKGSTLIAVDSAELLHPVKAAITQAILTGSQNLPVPTPQFGVVIDMIVGSLRTLDFYKAHPFDPETIKGAASYEPVYVPSNVPIDWTNAAGLALIKQRLEDQSNAVVVMMQHSDTQSNGLPVEGFVAMQRMARLAKSFIVLVAILDPLGAATFGRLADEYFTAKKCEPDPDFDSAFVLDCEALSQVPALGQGKVIGNYKLTARGYETDFTPFVSEQVDVRLMAILKALGFTLKDIGGLIHKDKSNVSRDLKGVPLLKKMAFTKEDLTRWLEACGKGADQIRQSLDIFSKWEKAQDVAQPVQVMRNDRNARNTARKPR